MVILLTICEIFSRIEVENRHFRPLFLIFALYSRSGGTTSNINVIYALLKSTSSGLKFCRWQYGSIFIRLSVVASQICEIARNSEKIRTYSSSRSSKVIDLDAYRKRIWNFLLVIVSTYRCIAITNLPIIAVFGEYLRHFLIDLHQIYRHSNVPKNTSPCIFPAS